MKVYTKTGDEGETGLLGGSRVHKDDRRIELYGTVDELNSFVGLITSHNDDKRVNDFLQKVQSELFNLGSNLACPIADREKFKLVGLTTDLVFELEKKIDLMEDELEPLKNFILPGGSKASSYSHVARTVCRRAERRMITFERENPKEKVEGAIIFLNRFSDYLFVLARYFNKKANLKDVLWS